MPKMKTADLQPMLSAQRADALSGMTAADLSGERAKAMNYYLGNMEEDMPAPEGRSKTVSTDVADAVEGALPILMDIFCGSDEVVRFEPVGPEDEEAAQQETDYVNHVFMQQNEGFRVLYDFFKDALLQKNGFVKAWWEESEQEERETYYDLTEEQYQALAYAVEMSGGAMKIVEHSTSGEDETSHADYEGAEAEMLAGN